MNDEIDESDESSHHHNRKYNSTKHPSVVELKKSMVTYHSDSLEENGGAPNEEAPKPKQRDKRFCSLGNLGNSEERSKQRDGRSHSLKRLGNNDIIPPNGGDKNEAKIALPNWHKMFDSFFHQPENNWNMHVNEGTPIELPPTDESISRACSGAPLITWRKTTFQELQPNGGGVTAFLNESVDEDDVDELHTHQISPRSTAVDSRIWTGSSDRKRSDHKIFHSNTEPQQRPAIMESPTYSAPPTKLNSIPSFLLNAKSFTIGQSAKTANAIKFLLSQRKGHRKMFDSYDYQIVDSKVWHDRERKESSYLTFLGLKCGGHAPEILFRKNFGRDARVAIILLGILVALGSIVVSECTDHLLDWKLGYIIDMAEQYQGDKKIWGFGRAFLVNVGISCAFGCVAFFLVVLSPASQGSGLAEVKTILNGVHLEKITSLWTAMAKCIGVVFAVSSGLPVGIEGPMIHLGLVLGAHVSQVRKVLHSDRHRRDFAACGTAAGVAAAFHTPLGGVLFALEEGASFWTTLLTWRAFSCAVVTMITIYFVYGVNHKTVPTEVFNVIGNGVEYESFPTFSIWQLAAFALIGAIGGCIGGIWIIVNTKLSLWRRRLKIVGRFVEIMLIVISMSTLTWWLPYIKGACLDIPAGAESRFFKNTVQYNCE